MYEKQLHVDQGQRLTLAKMSRHVEVIGWDEAHVLVAIQDGEEGDLTIESTENGPALSSTKPCVVKVPATLPVTIQHAQGNLRVVGLADLNVEQVRGHFKVDDVETAVAAEVYGNLKARGGASLRLVGTVYGNAAVQATQHVHVQNVRGNARFKAVERLNLSRVSGNLRVKQINGPLDAEKVGGNAVLRGVAGKLTLEQVAGNLVAKDLVGGGKVSRIGGNLALAGQLGTGCTYRFSADGNAAVRLNEDEGAHITLTARGPMLVTRKITDEHRDGKTVTGTLGDGGPELVVEARGSLILGGSRRGGESGLHAELTRQMEDVLGSMPDLESVSRQVEESLNGIDLEAIGRQVNQEVEQALSRLRVKLEGIDWDRVGHRTEQAVSQAMSRLQRDVERLAERAAHRQEWLERRAQREQERLARRQRRRAAGFRRDQPMEAEPSTTGSSEQDGSEQMVGQAAPAPSFDEERMSILRMVEQGQITPAEADMLLDALG